MQNGTIQFIQITPEQFHETIISGVKSELEKLKSEFQPKQPTEFLTRNQVKELLDVDLSTVHNWTKKGKLQAYGIAGRVYYKRSEIEQALQPINF
jgi:hypothetical protein